MSATIINEVSGRVQLHVMAGALVDAQGRILIAQRPAGKYLEGFWEFPGGKLNPGESRREGLERELKEELGVGVVETHPLIRIRHRYPDRDVVLDIWRVLRFTGDATGLDGQALRWCAPEDLVSEDVLHADRPAVTALRLPDRLNAMSGANFQLAPSANFETGPRLAAGRKLTKAAKLPSATAPRGGSRLYGILCADEAAARRAASDGADFVALQNALPENVLRELCEAVNAPVYCRGFELAAAWELGARGTIDTEFRERRRR